jgi:hypothetical protein
MRRLTLPRLAILAALCIEGIALACGMFLPRHRITNETIGQIRRGISEEEVVELLGAPAGYRAFGKDGWLCWGGPFRDNRTETWVGDEAGVEVYFDQADRVLGCSQLRVEDTIEWLPARVARWHGL